MPNPLDNVRVAIPEHRYPEQLAQLLQRYGATVISCPLVRETPLENAETAKRFIELCETTSVDYIVFYTGVGVDFLFRAVNKPEALSRSKILARGPKAVAALKRAGIRVDLVAEQPTTEGIIQTLSKHELKGKSVLVQLYGQDNPELQSALEAMGSRVTGLSLYSYDYASDGAAITELLRKIRAHEVDAICFTSGPQIRFLIEAAEAQGVAADVRQHLQNDVVVVSVGEVTGRALEAAGVKPHVMPEEPRMGTMVKALAEFYEKRKQCTTPSS
jgi:uroporphyrinogen-III synthase